MEKKDRLYIYLPTKVCNSLPTPVISYDEKASVS